jgi:uncharacterized membrane protein
MKLLTKLFFRGLAAVLPLALTCYLVYYAVAAGEALLHRLIVWVGLQESSYWPGMGYLFSIVLVMLVGLLMYSFVVRRAYAWCTRCLQRIPIVKSIYGMIVDVVQLAGSPDERPFQRVVLVRHDSGLEQVGFVTRDGFRELPTVGADHVAVYLPMSYQLGGFTVIAPRARVRDVAMTVEEALRFCVTAGVQRRDAGKGDSR